MTWRSPSASQSLPRTEPAQAFNSPKWRSRGPPSRKWPRLWSRSLPSSPKLTAEFAPSSFSSTTRLEPFRCSSETTRRSSSPGCRRDPVRCGVRGYLWSRYIAPSHLDHGDHVVEDVLDLDAARARFEEERLEAARVEEVDVFGVVVLLRGHGGDD